MIFLEYKKVEKTANVKTSEIMENFRNVDKKYVGFTTLYIEPNGNVMVYEKTTGCNFSTKNCKKIFSKSDPKHDWYLKGLHQTDHYCLAKILKLIGENDIIPEKFTFTWEVEYQVFIELPDMFDIKKMGIVKFENGTYGVPTNYL